MTEQEYVMAVLHLDQWYAIDTEIDNKVQTLRIYLKDIEDSPDQYTPDDLKRVSRQIAFYERIQNKLTILFGKEIRGNGGKLPIEF